MRATARSRTAAATRRIAATRYDWSTRYWIVAIPTTRATTSATAPAIVAARRGSASDTVPTFYLERHPDLFEARASPDQLARHERVITEASQLEQPRELLHGGARQRQPGQRLAHEFARRLPRRSRHACLGREALESPVASDDGGPRIGLAGHVVEALFDRFAQWLGRGEAIPALEPVGDALGEEQDQRHREPCKGRHESHQPDEPSEPRQRHDRNLGSRRLGIGEGLQDTAAERKERLFQAWPRPDEDGDDRDQRQDGHQANQYLHPPRQLEETPVALEQIVVPLDAAAGARDQDRRDNHGGQRERRRRGPEEQIRHVHAQTYRRRFAAASVGDQEGRECEQK